jgi:hypothetical protein
MPRPKVVYTCGQCGYKTNRKSNFLDHTNRKSSCARTPENPSPINVSNTITINNPTTINNNTTINTTITTQLRPLGQEDVTFLVNDPDFQTFVKKCILEQRQGLCDFLKHKHFNAQHPENTNIRKFNRRSPFMQYFDGHDWSTEYDEYVLDRVFSGMEKQFKEYESSLINSNAGYAEWNAMHYFMIGIGDALNWKLRWLRKELYVSQEEKNAIRKKMFALASEIVVDHSSRQPIQQG